MNIDELIQELRDVKDMADNHAMGHIRGVVSDAIELIQEQSKTIDNLQKQFDLAVDFLEKINTWSKSK
jgi:hypothetical protein